MAEGARVTAEAGGGPSRPLVFGIAGLVTLGGILGALYLGAWAFDTRRYTTHEGRLAKLLGHKPTLEQVDQAFRNEGTLPLGAADDAAALRALARRYAGEKASAVEAGGSPHTRVYAAGDMIYFVYFDGARVMRGYTLVSR